MNSSVFQRAVFSGIALLSFLANIPVANSQQLDVRVAPIELIGRDLIVLMNSLNEGVNDPTKTLPRGPMLERAIGAVERTPLYKMAALGRRRASSQLDEIDAGMSPQIQGGVNAGQRTYEAGVTSSGAYNALSLTVRQRVFDFGATEAQREAVENQLGQSVRAEAQQRNELLLNGIKLFYETQRSLIQVRLARENLQARRSLVNFIRERAELGASSIADVVRAETQVADGLDLLSGSLKSLSQAQARYREFYLEEAQPYILPMEPDIQEIASSPMENYIENHPLLIQAELKIASAMKNYEAVQLGSQGELALELKYSQNGSFAGTAATTDRTLMLVFNRALYDGGGSAARAQAAYVAVDEATLEKERLTQDLMKKIRDSLAEYNGQVASLRSRMLVFKGAEDAYAITKDLYAFSRSSLFELLRAQETLYSSGQKLIDSIVDRAIAKYQLLFDTNELMGLDELKMRK